MAITSPVPQRGGANTPGTVDDPGTENQAEWSEKQVTFNDAVATKLNGDGLDDDGLLNADPDPGVSAALSQGMPANTALWYLQKQISGSPANLRWVGTWDAATNTPDLTVAANQGETDAATGLFTGYAYQVSVDGVQDLGTGPLDLDAGDWVHFGQGGAVYHTDNSDYYDRDTVGVRTSDPDPAAFGRHYTLSYDPGGSGFTLPPLANGNIGDVVTFTNVNGETATVAPNGGEILNGTVNGTFVSDSTGQFVRCEKVSATEWRVGLNVVTGGADVLLHEAPTLINGGTLSSGMTWTEIAAAGFEFLRLDRNTSTNAPDCDWFPTEFWAPGGNLQADFGANGTVIIGTNATTGNYTVANTSAGGGAWKLYGIYPKTTFQAGTLIAEPAEDVLIDVEGVNNSFYPFSTGQTWAQVKATYENLRFDINVSDSGTSNVKPATIVIPTDKYNLFASNANWALLSHHGVTVNISDPSDTDTGFIYSQSSGDTPTDGRMQFRVTGIRKQFNAIRAEDLPVDDQGAAGYIDLGTTRIQWGQIDGNGGNIATGTIDGGTMNLPAPFANSNYVVTLSLEEMAGEAIDGGAGDVGIDLWVETKTTTAFAFNRDDQVDFAHINFIAIGLKP